MGEMDQIGLEKGDDMATQIRKVKDAMAGGKLAGLQELRKERNVLREKAKAEKQKRLDSVKEQLKSIGIDVDADGMDETYRKLKQAIDRGELTKLASRKAAAGSGGEGSLWGEDDDEGPW